MNLQSISLQSFLTAERHHCIIHVLPWLTLHTYCCVACCEQEGWMGTEKHFPQCGSPMRLPLGTRPLTPTRHPHRTGRRIWRATWTTTALPRSERGPLWGGPARWTMRPRSVVLERSQLGGGLGTAADCQADSVCSSPRVWPCLSEHAWLFLPSWGSGGPPGGSSPHAPVLPPRLP